MATLTIDTDKLTPELLKMLQQLAPIPMIPVGSKETHIVGVLDESGSMNMCKQATIEAYNAFVDDVIKNKDKGGVTYISTLPFQTGKLDFVCRHANLGLGLPLKIDNNTYRPGAGTPLYDALMKAMNELERYDTPGGNKAFLVSVFTDGEENSSRTNAATVSEKVRALQATGRWTFTVAGANISLDDLSQVLSIPRQNMLLYNATNEGIAAMGMQQVSSTNSYMQTRGVGGQSVGNFYVDAQTVAPDLDFERQMQEQAAQQRQWQQEIVEKLKEQEADLARRAKEQEKSRPKTPTSL